MICHTLDVFSDDGHGDWRLQTPDSRLRGRIAKTSLPIHPPRHSRATAPMQRALPLVCPRPATDGGAWRWRPATWSSASSSDCPAARMDVAQAQQSRVVTIEGLLSPADVAKVLECASEYAESAGRDVSKSDGRWETLYLHTGAFFQTRCPDVLAKIVSGVTQAEHAEPSMGRLMTSRQPAEVGLRCIEYHEVRPGGSLPDVKHYDTGSMLTVDIMLSQAGEFAGGEFSTLESDDRLVRQQSFDAAATGDALLFVSHKYHCVQPVISGLRRVLVIEFWLGPDRHCEHRCDTCPSQPCRYQFCPELAEMYGTYNDDY